MHAFAYHWSYHRRIGPTVRRAFTGTDAAGCVLVGLFLLTLFAVGAGGVREGNKQGRCLSNLGRIVYASTIHAAQDPGEMAIPTHPSFTEQNPHEPHYFGAYEWGGKSGRGQTDHFGDKPGDPVNSRWGTRAGQGPARRPINRILYGDSIPDYTKNPGENNANWLADTQADLDVFRCPSDSGYSGIHSPAFRDEKLTAYDHFGTSYAANSFFVGVFGENIMNANGPFLHRLSDIVAPSTTIGYQENNGRFAWAAAEDSCDFISGIAGTVRSWHGKDWTFNTAFIDGHADTMYMRGYVNATLSYYPPFTEGDRSSQDERAQSYRCIVIRGERWRKDTLPADFVFTSVTRSPNSGDRAGYEDGIE